MKDNNIDMEKSNLRSINNIEGYYPAIHNQELPIKYLKNK